MKSPPAVQRHRKIAPSAILVVACAIGVVGCSRDRPAPSPGASASGERRARTAEVLEPQAIEGAAAYRAALGQRGAELYLPPWFSARRGADKALRYDLLVHFHGEGKWQQANLEHAKLNAAVVSVNLGVGTDPYAAAFRAPDAFDRLLADTQAEIAKSGRAQGAELGRIALTAWSAGFSSIAKAMTDPVAERIDAILLADGFFTFFTDPKRRVVNVQGLEKFARFAEQAKRDEKLFAITHTTIPTGPYPSVGECVSKLLDMVDVSKTDSSSMGPGEMRELYRADAGSFHIRGYHGVTAADHVRQLHAMGETTYPLLKSRWEQPASSRVAAAPPHKK